MRVLVTGATTPIGRRVAERLAARPDVEVVLALGVEGECPELVARPKIEYRCIDLTRSRHVRRLLFGPVRDLGVDRIVHLATHRRATEGGPRVHALNVDAVRELVAMAEDHPTLERFVLRSFSDVYELRADRPVLIGEDHPVSLSAGAPQWVRDRVEVDYAVSARMGISGLSIAVLRCAECLAADCGSQPDYLRSRVCFVPLGFDPMLNLLTIGDMARAVELAVVSDAQGIFNVPGADTLPLSRLIRLAGRRPVPVVGPLLGPLYALRTLTIGTDFRYDLNYWRFHFSGVLDGRRAARDLGFEPSEPIDWDHLLA